MGPFQIGSGRKSSAMRSPWLRSVGCLASRFQLVLRTPLPIPSGSTPVTIISESVARASGQRF